MAFTSSGQNAEAAVRKIANLAIVLSLAVLAATVSAKLYLQPTDAAGSVLAPTISIEELHRSIDRQALPIMDVKDPV
jgi:hypothetical protein